MTSTDAKTVTITVYHTGPLYGQGIWVEEAHPAPRQRSAVILLSRQYRMTYGHEPLIEIDG